MIPLHFTITRQPFQCFVQDTACIWILRIQDAVVDPWPIPAGSDYPRLAQVGKMPADFRLMCLKDLNEEAHANLAASHEVEQAQPRAVRERAEEQVFI